MPSRMQSFRTPTMVGVALSSLLTAASPAAAQSNLPAPTITGFVQMGWHAQVSSDPYPGFIPVTPPGAAVGSGFYITNARLYFSGTVDDALGYLIQTNFAGGTGTLLVAAMRWDLNAQWRIWAGRILKPFGRDRLRPRHQLLALDRSMGSLLIANGLVFGSWDVGAMAEYRPAGSTLVRFGAFNGRPPGPTVDNDTGKNYVGRVTLPVGAVDVGINASYQRIGSRPRDERGNLAWGLDAQYTSGSMIAEAEFINADNHAAGVPAPTARDVGLTFGIDTRPMFGTRRTQFVLRIERYDPDTKASGDEMLMVVPSLNLEISDASRFQCALIHQVPSAGSADAGTSLVVQWQVNFF